VLEGERMRSEGVPLGRVREWGPSPAWPEGRGVFLLRPLLGCGREVLKNWLRDPGLPWIDDSANADLRYARVRARAVLAAETPTWPTPLAKNTAEKSEENQVVITNGQIFLDRKTASPHAVAVAVACASGGAKIVRGAPLERLFLR
ncbi:hypothetical protein J3326_10630, partial [Leuconostoc mesenteroides]|uniref:ATP-binding protein n=1 Tax=Leuconostoc mesenteroides TaxID=1245 RepID=UPI00295294D8